MPSTFYIESLGCPKNQVDSDKLFGLESGGNRPTVSYPHPAYMTATTTFRYTRLESPNGTAWADAKCTAPDSLDTGLIVIARSVIDGLDVSPWQEGTCEGFWLR